MATWNRDDSDLVIGTGIGSTTIGSNLTISNNEIDCASGDLLLDAASDLILDADSSNILLKDNGVLFGSLNNNSSELTIKSGSTSAINLSGANTTLLGSLSMQPVSGDGSNESFLVVDTGDNIVKKRTGAQVRSDLGISDNEIIDWTTGQGSTDIHQSNIPWATGQTFDNDNQGLVPSPGSTGTTTRYLREDGYFQVPPDTNTQLSTEQVQDIVGGMFSSNSETRINVTYDDTGGKIDLLVDDMTANTQNTTTLSFVDSSNDIILRNTTGGAGSGTDDIKFVAGSNITLTHTDADNITIASANTTYSVGDGGLTTNDFTNDDHTKLNGIEDNATADQTQADINGLAITEVGTITSGVWTATPIAHAYIGNDAIEGDNLADNAVDSEHYTDGSIDHVHLSADAVDGDNIADDSINSEHYVNGSIDTAHIADDQVTYAKIQNVSATDRILGRDSAGAGVIEEITPGNLKTMLSLGNVEDTALSTWAGTTNITTLASNLSLGGSPTTTTQSAGDDSTKIATTAYVETAVSNLVDSAPGTLNTLNELAEALGDDASFSTTVTNSIATKAPLASPTFTGTVTMPATIASAGDLTLDVAGDITLDADGGDVTIVDNSPSTAKPSFQITSTEAGTYGPVMSFYHNSASPADTDYICMLNYIGKNDAGQDVTYMSDNLILSDVADGEERAYYQKSIMTHGSLRNAIKFSPQSDGTVDTDIGHGASSITEIAGDLTITGGNITNAITFDNGITNAGTISAGTWSGTALVAGKVPAHDDLTGFVANEHIDWTSASAGTIDASNYTNTTYSVMASGNSYAAGLVAAGSGTHSNQFLRKDGTWVVPENDNTTYSAGSLLDLSTTTFNVDLTELTDGTADVVGSEDELVYLDNNVQKRKQIDEIKLGQFNNDAGWTSNTGDIDRVKFIADSGNHTISSGDADWTINGGEGIDTSISTSTITIAAEEATSVNKGVAAFSTDNFLVSSGSVTIKDLGVATAELDNRAVTYAKMQNVTDARMLGNNSGSASSPTEMTQGDVLSFLGVEAGATADQATGISDGNILECNANVADDDFLRIDGTEVEGLSAAQVLSAIGAQASLTFGLNDTNAIVIDGGAADNQFAHFTASGIESLNYSSTKAKLDLDHLFTLVGAASDTANDLATFTGSTIADNQTIKEALQALETAVELRLTNNADDTMAGTLTIDKDYSVATSGTTKGLVVDLDRTGNVAAGIDRVYGMHSLVDVSGGSNHVQLIYGIESKVNGDDMGSGESQAIGVSVDVDGTADTNIGINNKTVDGGIDYQQVSSADTGDYFRMVTTTHGATTLTTVDDDAANADLTFTIDGDIHMNAASNINIEATNWVEFDGCGVGFDLVTPTYNASDTNVDFQTGNKQFVTFGSGNITDLNLIFPKTSGNFTLILKQDGSGSRTVTNYKVWDRDATEAASGSATVKFAGGSNPTLTTAASKTDIISFFYDADNEIAYGVASLNF